MRVNKALPCAWQFGKVAKIAFGRRSPARGGAYVYNRANPNIVFILRITSRV